MQAEQSAYASHGQLSIPGSAASAAEPAGMTQEQKIEQLQKLAQLKRSGILTEQEFEAQKQKILAQ